MTSASAVDDTLIAPPNPEATLLLNRQLTKRDGATTQAAPPRPGSEGLNAAFSMNRQLTKSPPTAARAPPPGKGPAAFPSNTQPIASTATAPPTASNDVLPAM